MSCLDLFDQFYSLPLQHKTTNKARTPPPVHIENLHTLESETAALLALSVTDEVARPRKSSLAAPRSEGTLRSPKIVRFSDCVQIRTVPARRLDLFSGTGMDLVNIIKATNDEFASLIGKNAQPDSPAPWQASSKAHWVPEYRAPALSCIAGRSEVAMRAVQSKRKPSAKRSLHLASKAACGTQFGGTRNIDAFHSVRPWQVGPASPLRPRSNSYMTQDRLASKVRTRLALLRYMRRARQRVASQRHSTALLKRRCQSRLQSLGQYTTRSSHHVLRLRSSISPQQQSTHHNRNQTSTSANISPVQQNVEALNHPAHRVKTYVDHIRDQRNPPKALPSHVVSDRPYTTRSSTYK